MNICDYLSFLAWRHQSQSQIFAIKSKFGVFWLFFHIL